MAQNDGKEPFCISKVANKFYQRLFSTQYDFGRKFDVVTLQVTWRSEEATAGKVAMEMLSGMV